MKKTAWLNRNFVFLLLGQISSLIGNGTLKLALAMYVLERTGSAAVFAGMLSAAMLPTIVLSPFGGVLADRMNRRALMIALDALSGLAALLAGAALPLGHDLPLIAALLVAALTSLFIAGTAVVGFPFLVRTVLGLSAELYGAAESAMGVAAVLGSLFAGLTAGRLRLCLAWVFLGVGAALALAGGAFLAPLDAMGRYLVLTALFCACQFGCSVFSTCAISAIQRRTPEAMMGKVMAYVFTLSLCAQPLGQILCGALFDRCGARAYWVLVPSGLLVCLAGVLSRRLLRRMGKGE